MSCERSLRYVLVVFALAAVTVMPAVNAWAGAIPMTAALVVVDAERNGETGQFSAIFPVSSISGEYTWDLLMDGDGPQTIVSTQNGVVLGNLETLGITFKADPAVSLDFSVRAGAYGTNFTITSAVMGFSPIPNAQGYATAAVTVTDRTLDTATFAGLFSGGKAYQARYNGSGFSPGTTWASLISTPITTAVGDSGVGNERKPAPPPLWAPIGATVSSISAEFKFSLTADDSASGTSMFEVVPEPASLSLLLIGGSVVSMMRRRR